MKLFLKNLFSKKSKEENDIEIQDVALDTQSEVTSISDLWEKLKHHRKLTRRSWLVGIGIASLLLAGFLCYTFFRTSTTFYVLDEMERADINGTEYAEFGKGIIKYRPDGISSITSQGEIRWSSTFNMQSPIVDIREKIMAVAEKNGTQVYIYNEDGLLGQFQTVLPIEKVSVSNQGVVAVILQDEDVTWINLYDINGVEIVTNRTSVEESGYPLDIALSPDGMKMAVAYLGVTQGIMNTKVCFYNFGAVGQAEQDNLVNSVTYDNEVVPKVIFANETTAVAFRSGGFSIFEGKQNPELKKEEAFDSEIVSVFQDNKSFGIIFASDDAEHMYKMQVYNMAGKRIAERYLDIDYKEVKLVNDKIIIYNDSVFEIYETNGDLKFTGNYPKAITDIISVKGFGKYLILSRESSDLIKLR